MFMVLPAAVLFATVFSIGAFTRHAEITAAKASGISFYRMIAPILLGALFAFGLDLGLGKIVPITNQRRSQLLLEDRAQLGSQPLQLRVRRRVRTRLQGVRAAHGFRADAQPADRAQRHRADVSDVPDLGRFGVVRSRRPASGCSCTAR